MNSSAQNVVILGYWNFRGLANPIKLILEHVGQPYEPRVPDTREAWFEGKSTVDLPFPNLPYLIDGNTKLTQSRAVLRYLARKHGLAAGTEEEMQKQDMVDGVLSDISTNWFRLAYLSEDFEKAKQEYATDKVGNFRDLDQWLSGREYLTGNRLNYTDFILFDIMNNHTAAMPELFSHFRNLQKFHSRMMGQNGIKDYVTSERNPKAVCSPLATWKAGTC